MIVTFTERATAELGWWKKHDPAVVARIRSLLESMQTTPFSGIGKPEPLKHGYSGCWSRRISQRHRLVYRVKDGEILILQCRFHYGH